MILGIIGRIIAILMLVWAIAEHEYGYFTLLRFVVCIVSAYGAFQAHSQDKEEWTWMLGGIAVLFNPIFPIHLNRELWSVIDIFVAIILFVSLFLVRVKNKSVEEQEP